MFPLLHIVVPSNPREEYSCETLECVSQQGMLSVVEAIFLSATCYGVW